jgi:D-glycero-beta-D-manno-heptose-7-phosphate kinase
MSVRPVAPKVPVLVVGDSMLDRYWEGRVDRISPEAPVPVLQVDREFSRAGGAANVALNLAALEAPVSLLTLVGADEAGDTLRGQLQRAGVTLHSVGGSRHRTTLKIRCVAQRHQLLRTDFEEQAAEDCVAELHARYAELVPTGGVVVFSDYDKGALRHCAELIALARARGCRVLVDPKGTDFTRYRGADVLKPNHKELQAAAGACRDERELQRRCMALRRRLDIGAVLLTRGEQGMTLFQHAGVRHHPAQVREVFDVSGAGDTVIATLARFLAAGHSLDDSVHWANRAAGLVVAKFGTASITLAELHAAHGQPTPVQRSAAPGTTRARPAARAAQPQARL